jgi:hypothetical protein
LAGKKMTKDEAINLAELKAHKLNIPWSRENIIAKRRRLWPFLGNWRIVARVKNKGAIVTIDVSERTGFIMPKRVLYPAGGLN